jgi:hypothetical protein
MLLAAGACVDDSLPEVIQAEASTAVQHHIGTVALGQAGGLRMRQQQPNKTTAAAVSSQPCGM